MFGHQNDQSNDSNTIPDDSIQGALNDQPVDNGPLPPAPAPDSGAPSSEEPWQHPGTPIDAPVAPTVIDDIISPAGGFPKAPSFAPGPAPIDDSAAPISAPGDHIGNFPEPSLPPAPVLDEDTTHELIDIKQHALTELFPLIDQLDQPPEEKFRTIMMMIQASDDQHLVKAAYQAAHGIEDEKIRARALLDIVNEINYFTQQPEN